MISMTAVVAVDRLFKNVGHACTPRDELDDRFHETGLSGTGSLLVDSSFAIGRTRIGVMAGWRHAVELAMSGEDIGRLMSISRSRTEWASRVQRARMLLAYQENPSFFAVGEKLGVHHQTVQRCVERARAAASTGPISVPFLSTSAPWRIVCAVAPIASCGATGPNFMTPP
jgi:hypothetical protein